MALPGLLFLLLLIVGPVTPAGAGQIVFDHGSDIWVMNDDGTGAKPLVSVAQVAGMSSIGDPSISPNGGTELAFEATTLANEAPAGSGPAGACGLQCTGIYTLNGGAVTRLSGAPAPCGPAPQWCGSFSTEPDWTAAGNVAYEYSQYTWEYSCLSFPCYWAFTSALEEIYTMPPTPGGAPGTKWTLQHTGISSNVAPVTDPADASKVAYIGTTVNCSTQCQYPIYVSSGSGEETAVVYDDNLISDAWSPDGRRFADVEGGGERGIWTYASNAASTPGKKFTWALRDPIQTGSDPGNNPFDVTFSNVTWLGNEKLLFAADDNLWTIPASCGSGGTPCQFPQDATQLTTGGTAGAPDHEPTWTSATTPLVSPAGGGGPPQSQPTVTHPALSGVGQGKAKLAFSLSAGSGGAITGFDVKLPHGLKFSASRKRLAKGIVLRDSSGKKLKFTAKLAHRSLEITLKQPETALTVTIGPPALAVTRALSGKVKHGKAKTLTVLVTAISAGGSSVLPLHLKSH